MFKNYLKIAFRNLWKNKGYSLINIGGLAVGLSACLLLLLYVSYERNFDHQFKDLSQIYLVELNWHDNNGRISTSNSAPAPLATVINQSVSGAKEVARLNGPFKMVVGYRHNSFRREGSYADASFFHIFNHKFLEGNPQTALATPDAIVLTESLAKTLFGEEDPLNKVVKLDNNQSFHVTGVIADIPFNTSIRFDYLLPWSRFEKNNPGTNDNWYNFSYLTFVKLYAHASLKEVNKTLAPLINKHFTGEKIEAFLYPLSRWHLYGKFSNGKAAGGKISQVRLFAWLALGILLIACINFMNLSTARSEKRVKEVGIRKTLGAKRGALIIQFIGESFLLTLISVIIATILVALTLPFFNHALNIHLSLYYDKLYYWLGLVVLILVTSLIAGSYPAFYLSSFAPGIVLKKKIRTRNPVLNIRQLLVIIQFSFAVGLVIATAIIYEQIQYIKNRPVGYNKNNLVQMDADAFLTKDGNLAHSFTTFKNELLRSDAVVAACPTSLSITDGASSTWGIEWPGMDPEGNKIIFGQIATTYGFSKTFDIQIKEGRDFSPDFPSDSSAVMLNETAVKVMHLKDPIGKRIKWQGKMRKVTGVFKDFIRGSPFEPIQPMIVGFQPHWTSLVNMRLNPDQNISSSLATIKKIYHKMDPAYPFQVQFVDEAFANKFKTEKDLQLLSNLFGGLAIFVSCLGLLGLAAFSAEQRTKEVGIRKVMGASNRNIIVLLSGSFLKLVIIANIIGGVLGGWLMHRWLMKYTFRIGLSGYVFLFAAALSLLVTLLTVSVQAWRAAKANPVKALKYE